MTAKWRRTAMRAWPKWPILFIVLLVDIWASHADGWILFVNSYNYIYQQDGTRANAPFVAQLYLDRGQGDGWAPLSQPVPLRDGLFRGGVVPITGVNGGQTFPFMIRIWNSSSYSSYDEALQEYSPTGVEYLWVTVGSSPSLPAALSGFSTLYLPCDPYRAPQIVSVFTTRENQEVSVSFPLSNRNVTVCPDTLDAGYINNFAQHYGNQNPSNRISGLLLGNIQGVWNSDDKRDGPPFTYVPRRNVYGTDLIYYRKCWDCGDFDIADAIQITIAPSPDRKRPTLSSVDHQNPSLLGLNAHRYRIDRSTDLKNWETAGTVTGNYTTVDLSPFVAVGASAHFLRATEITSP